MISLKPVLEEKLFYQVLDLGVAEGQKAFVASNAFSFAEAWFHKEIARPFAIMLGDAPVGFFMGCVDHAKPYYCVWRLMIDRRHQGKGYGRAALNQAVAFLKSQGATEVFLSYAPSNAIAAKLYESAGFVLTGEIESDGEVVAKKVV